MINAWQARQRKKLGKMVEKGVDPNKVRQTQNLLQEYILFRISRWKPRKHEWKREGQGMSKGVSSVTLILFNMMINLSMTMLTTIDCQRRSSHFK